MNISARLFLIAAAAGAVAAALLWWVWPGLSWYAYGFVALAAWAGGYKGLMRDAQMRRIVDRE